MTPLLHNRNVPRGKKGTGVFLRTAGRPMGANSQSRLLVFVTSAQCHLAANGSAKSASGPKTALNFAVHFGKISVAASDGRGLREDRAWRCQLHCPPKRCAWFCGPSSSRRPADLRATSKASGRARADAANRRFAESATVQNRRAWQAPSTGQIRAPIPDSLVVRVSRSRRDLFYRQPGIAARTTCSGRISREGLASGLKRNSVACLSCGVRR